MAGKKNMGRVKHYRHSFYTGPQRVKRVLLVVLAVLVLFGLGWLIGPPVIDLGTRTWYSIKESFKDRPQSPSQSESQASSAAQSENQAGSQPQEPQEPQEPAAPLGAQVVPGGWSFVSLSSIDTAEKAAAQAQQLAAQGVKYAVIPLKDEQGYIYYPSSLEVAAPSVAATTIDPAQAVKAFEEAGVIPVAQICAFRDPKAPYTDRTMGVHYQGTEYFWLDAAVDAGGKPWLDPYSPEAIRFIESLMQEARQMGFEQLLLTGVQFPFRDDAYAGYQAANGVGKTKQLADLIGSWQQKTQESGGVLWVEYSMEQAAGRQPASLGGGALAELGIQQLVLRATPSDDPEADQQLLAEARAAAAAGGAQHVVLRQGVQAGFDE